MRNSHVHVFWLSLTPNPKQRRRVLSASNMSGAIHSMWWAWECTVYICFLVSTHICPPQSFTCDAPPLCRKWVSTKVQDLHTVYTDEDLCNLQMPFVNKMPCIVARVLALEACPLHDVLRSPSKYPKYYDALYYCTILTKCSVTHHR